MLNAIWFTGNTGGFFWNKSGLPLLIGAVALVFLIRGGGKYSIDRAIGREL
jgi:putative oxidoreductase